MPANEINLDGLTDMVGVQLRIAHILAEKVFREASKPGMASGHYSVLGIIRQNPGINQSNLAKCMYLDRSSMVPILDQFEEKGWIERRRRQGDRRAYALHLTSRGASVLEEADILVGRLENQITDSMGKKNRDRLLSLTRQLQAALLDI